MAGLHSDPLTNYIRDQEAQKIIDAVNRLLSGTDYYNRNDDIRFGALRSLGGYSDERRIEELMVDDLIRRLEFISYLPTNPISRRELQADE
jgi:hypothetical protein